MPIGSLFIKDDHYHYWSHHNYFHVIPYHIIFNIFLCTLQIKIKFKINCCSLNLIVWTHNLLSLFPMSYSINHKVFVCLLIRSGPFVPVHTTNIEHHFAYKSLAHYLSNNARYQYWYSFFEDFSKIFQVKTNKVWSLTKLP